MRKWLKHLKNQKGLTLIELLAVVVILGIIAAIAVPAIGNIIDNSKEDAHRSNALLIINATKLGVTTGEIATPNNRTDIKLDTLVTNGALDAVPSDPSADNLSYDGDKSFVTYIASGANKGYRITLVSKGSTAHKYYNNAKETDINNDKEPNMP